MASNSMDAGLITHVENAPPVAVARAARTETLRKAVDALAIVPTRQRIFPLARKLYNVMLYLAQQQGLERETYRASLVDITSKASFNSNDIDLVKNHLRQMNSTQVEWQSPTQGEGARWDVSNLIAHAAIEEPGRGRPVMIEWSFAPNIKRELLDPQRFAQISLAFQSTLRTHASLALFEICSRYCDNPAHLTARNPWEWWRPVLTGMPDKDASAYLEYKYFKRDVLTPTLAEINKVTELEVGLVEHREGRRVRELQFSVRRKEQDKRKVEGQPAFDVSLVGRAVRAGVSQLTAETLQQRHGDAVLANALDALASRIQAVRGTKIESLDRYLVGVAKRIAREGPQATPTLVSSGQSRGGRAAVSRADLESEFRERRRREARAIFDDRSEHERAEIVERFEAGFVRDAPPVIRRAYQKGGLQSPAIRAEFGRWLAEQTWGGNWAEANAEDLVELVVSGSTRG